MLLYLSIGLYHPWSITYFIYGWLIILLLFIFISANPGAEERRAEERRGEKEEQKNEEGKRGKGRGEKPRGEKPRG